MENIICLYTGPGSLLREPEDVKNLVCVDSVPFNIRRFCNLTSFSIVGENVVLRFPEVVYDIPTLEHLYINGKVRMDRFKLEDKPVHLKSLTLENIGNEDFDVLYIGELRNLEYVCVKNMRLALGGLYYLREKMRHLILVNTGLDYFPRSIYRLYRLRTLDISENEICYVSRRILDLVNLKNFAWSHKTRQVTELFFSVVPDQLPNYLREMMEIDISRKSREDYMSEVYNQPEIIPFAMDEDDYSDDGEDGDTIFDDYLLENLLSEDEFDDFEDGIPVDDGYESCNDNDAITNLSDMMAKSLVLEDDKPEFYIDYISREDKRVPNWEFLFDDSDDFENVEEDSDDDSTDFESTTENEDADDEYDSDYERDYENERF
jgi:hypothetical protein